MTLIDPAAHMEQFEDPHYRDTLLNAEFRLDIGDHQLIDPTSNRGEVVDVVGVEAAESGLVSQCQVYDVFVKDPFVEADPAGYEIVRSYIERLEDRLVKDGVNPLVGDREEATSREERNKYTRAWAHDPAVAGVSIWRDLVPTAVALEYLTNPNVGREITSAEGSVVLTPESAIQMRFVDDAVAIRDRAVAMQEIAELHLAELRRETENVRWLSLASGTAEPAIAAAKAAQEYAAEEGDNLNVELTVADYDRAALKFVRKNAERYGFSDDSIKTIAQNILVEDLQGELAEKTGSTELYDVVENMGFEEYLPQDGDELAAKKGAGLPQASEFTKRAFELVKPGGILISGNMVLDRPQIGYVFGIVDWPIINARSEESILRVYKEAGILGSDDAKIEMFRVRNAQTGGHVYNIVKVTKLA